MPEITLQVGASLSDGHENGQGSTLYTTFNPIFADSYDPNTHSNYKTAFLRFDCSSLPAGATINSAVLEFYVITEDDPEFDIYGEDVDSSAALDSGDSDNITSRTLTTEYVSWSDTGVGTGAGIESPDISDVIQEIVDRAGYDETYLGIILKPHVTTQRKFRFTAYDTSSANAAKLIIDYTAASTDPAGDYDPADGSTINFGSVDTGDTADETITVSETGDDTLTLSSPAFTGTNSGDFSMITSFPVSITDGGSDVDLTVRFAPGGTGARSGTLTFTTNDPANGTVSYTLAGTGTTPSGALDATVQVAASGDDGYEAGQGRWVDATGLEINVASFPDATRTEHRTGYLRFALPSNFVYAEIASAKLRFYVTGDDDPEFDIYGDLAATAAAVDAGDDDDITSRSLTTEYVRWSDYAVGSGWVDSPDITDVVQQIAQIPDLSGYLGIVLKPTTGATKNFLFASYDQGANLGAELVVSYTPPAPGGGWAFGVYDPARSTTINFGDVDTGGSADYAVTIANEGPVGLALGSAVFTGAGSAAYSWLGGPLPGTIAADWAGGTVPVAGTIRFAPTSGGPQPARLSFATNQRYVGTAYWDLTGTGISADGTVTWKVWADWNRDGDFDDTGEDISAYVMGARWNVGMRQAWQHLADESKCTLTVSNVDGRFSPENAAGAYYPRLKPHVPLRVASVSDLGTIVHWTGWIREIQPAPGELRERTAQIVAESARTYLQNTEVNLPLMTNVRADEVLPEILRQTHQPTPLGRVWILGLTGSGELGETTYLAGDGSDLWQFEVGRLTFPVVDVGGKSGWEAVRTLVESERGHWFYDRGGSATFWNRHHLLKIRDNDGTVSGWQEMDYVYGGEDIRNQITVECAPRDTSGTVTLWALPSALTVPGNSTYQFEARYRNQNGGAAVAATDIVQPSAAGTTLVCSAGTVSVSDFEERAQGALITLQNSGSETAIVTTLVIKGKAVTDYNPAVIMEMDGESVGLYGRREMQIKMPLVSDMTYAKSLAKYELKRRSQPGGRVRQVTLMGRDWAQQRQQLEYTVGTRVRVGDAQIAHTADYFVMGEEHEVRPGGDHRTTWTLEPADTNNFWVIGKSQLGIDTYLTV